MNWKRKAYQALAVPVILGMAAFCRPGLVVSAGEREQPPLIQSTTLEGDYRALVSLGLALTPRLEAEDRQQAFDNILCSCVRIQAKGHYGSGSIYKMLENEIIIVTNRHVLQYWNEDGYVTFFNGRVCEGTLLATAADADVGFLGISTAGFTYEELLALNGIRTLPASPAPGAYFFSVDMAGEWSEPLMREGSVIAPSAYLEDFQTEMLYGRGEAAPGMSGSGIFDACGNYLGMLTAATDQGEIAAVPSETIDLAFENIR